MSDEGKKRIGLIIGREKEWPSAFIAGVNAAHDNITAQLVKLSGTCMDDPCRYDLIIDRMSHEVPYYRTYVKYAAMRGTLVINDPFVWSVDSRFFGTAVANSLGLTVPYTIALPNKDVETDVVPDSFRNLSYPMNWEDIIQQVGVPAILKEVQSGGRRLSYRVHSVDDLIQRYDESGTRSMMLQSLLEGGQDIHCYVIGQKDVVPLRYNRDESRYEPDTIAPNDQLHDELIAAALSLTQAYGYDINLVEFVIKNGELIVINCTNPVPLINSDILSQPQFDEIVGLTINMAIERVSNPPPQRIRFRADQHESA